MTNDSTPSINTCPSCGVRGKSVKRITLEALLTPEAAERISGGAYRFCDGLDCPVVYYDDNAGDAQSVFTKDDMAVRVGVKERMAPRPVCYCFDHTIEEIDEQVAAAGRSTVLDDIKERMAVACWCETKSPQGSCCLGTVSKYVKLSMAEHGVDGDAAVTNREPHGDCCAAHGTGQGVAHGAGDESAGKVEERAGMLALGGAVLTAILSSACCWLPLLLLTFGASAAGMSAFFERWRPYFAVVAVVMLGLGFYLAYFRASCGSACCSPLARRRRRLSRGMLWVSAVIVAAFVLFPKYVGTLMEAFEHEPAAALVITDGTGAEARPVSELVFDVQGMSCEACAVTLKSALRNVPGVESASVDYDAKRATVRAADPAVVPGVLKAIEGVGYEGSVADGGG